MKPEAAAILPELVRHFGEPFGDSSALPTWYLSKLARQHVTVALNGDGGDELFGGYDWYRTALRLDQLANRTPALATRFLTGLSNRSGGRVARLSSRLSLPSSERFASLRRAQTATDRNQLYSAEFLRSLDGQATRYLSDRYSTTDGDAVARMQSTDIHTYLSDDLLVKVDRMSMAHSLEARSPLLDHELMEFALRLPHHLKIGWRGGKLILRALMRSRFPPGFLDRRKMGFSVPVAQWLRGELLHRLTHHLRHGILADANWFDLRVLHRLVDEHSTGRRDRSTQLWNLLTLAVWADAS